MTERKFKKMLRKQPNLISDDFVRSASESKQFVSASTLTAEQVVQRTKLRLDLPQEVWEHAEQTLASIRKRDKHFFWLNAQKRKSVAKFRSHRRLAIASILILLALAFFSLVPTGRSLARSVFDYIITIFDSKIDFSGYAGSPKKIVIPFFQPKVENEKPAYNNDDSEETISYSSIEEFSQETGKKPVLLRLPNIQSFESEIIEYSLSGISVRTVYSLSTGTVVITQKWLLGEDTIFETNGKFDNNTQILNGVKFTYTVDKIDGVTDGIAMLNDSILWITVTSDVDVAEVLAALAYE